MINIRDIIYEVIDITYVDEDKRHIDIIDSDNYDYTRFKRFVENCRDNLS